MWVKLEINYQPDVFSNENWFLDLGTTNLGRVDLFAYQGDQLVRHDTAGIKLPITDRRVPDRNLAFPVDLQPGLTTILLRIEGAAMLTINPSLASASAFLALGTGRNFLAGLIYGVLAIMVLYNALVYVLVREALFLSYTIALVSLLFCHLTVSGVGYQFLWPGTPEVNVDYLRISVAITLAACSWMALDWLKVRDWSTRLNTVNRVGIAVTMLVAFVPMFRLVGAPVAITLLFVGPALSTFTTCRALYLGIDGSRYFAFAWALLITSFLLGAAGATGAMPLNDWLLRPADISLIAVVVATSLGLARRINEEKLAKQIALSSAHAKSEFLANMSHEIRTPMNAIVGFTELTLSASVTREQREFLERIQTASHNLLGIINDILDFSKIEAGKLDLEYRALSVAAIFDNIQSMFVHRLEDRDLKLTTHIAPGVPARLIGDPLRLNQILINLVGNAVKFTESGEIRLSAHVVQEGADEVTLQISVADSGIGISPQQQQKLFQQFTQADTSITRQFGGTGLGLTITRQLVNLMQGRIWVDSRPGQGSTFHFTMNLKHSASGVTDYRNKTCVCINDGTEPLLTDWFTDYMNNVTFVSPEEAMSGGLPEFELAVLIETSSTPDSLISQLRTLADDSCVLIISQAKTSALINEFNTTSLKSLYLDELEQFLEDILETKPVRDQVHLITLKTYAETPPWEGAKVLLVEDNQVNQMLAKAMLLKGNMTVEIAGNGLDAIHALSDRSFDLVLMDVQMPVMDGLEATRSIRDVLQFQDLPVIAMTANAMRGDRERCMDAGMNDYITKPIDREVMYRTIGRWLHQKEGQPVH